MNSVIGQAFNIHATAEIFHKRFSQKFTKLLNYQSEKNVQKFDGLVWKSELKPSWLFYDFCEEYDILTFNAIRFFVQWQLNIRK